MTWRKICRVHMRVSKPIIEPLRPEAPVARPHPRRACLQAPVRAKSNFSEPPLTPEFLIAWTKCPYIARDGKVNPDRNQLHGLSQLNTFAQSTIDNVLASVIENDPNAANNAGNFIDAFLLHPKTGMLPSIPWGQTIRGPSQRGSYMGVLDFRVMVKVANAVQVLRVMNSPAWTSEREVQMVKWARSYTNWLETSELGMRPKRSAK
jgi:hypothetical protein